MLWMRVPGSPSQRCRQELNSSERNDADDRTRPRPGCLVERSRSGRTDSGNEVPNPLGHTGKLTRLAGRARTEADQ